MLLPVKILLSGDTELVDSNSIQIYHFLQRQDSPNQGAATPAFGEELNSKFIL